MKITDYKDREEAMRRLTRLQQKREELNKELWPIQMDINELEDAIQDYDNEQRALDI